MGKLQSWQNFDLTFGRESGDRIGDRIFALVKWTAEMGLTNVIWYLDRCTVKSEKNSYDVITDSCYSDLVTTEVVSNNIFATRNFAFSFEAFSFKNPKRDDLTGHMTFR